MKKILITLLIGFSLTSFAQTRYNARDLFTEKSIVWYGIDYSNARFIGSFGQFKDAGALDGPALKDKYFTGWNVLIIREHEKYNIAKFFKKDTQYNDISAVEKINSETDASKIMQENDYSFDESQLKNMVSKYTSTEKKEGLGVVFIAESYNHTKETASHYVVVFDIASKEILISEKFTEKPGGIGVKSYWASTILKTLEGVSDNYGKWKKMYGG
jgi:hypothetical protein